MRRGVRQGLYRLTAPMIALQQKRLGATALAVKTWTQIWQEAAQVVIFSMGPLRP